MRNFPMTNFSALIFPPQLSTPTSMLRFLILFIPIVWCGRIYEGCPRRSSATGEFTFIEEIRDDLLNLKPSIQTNQQRVKIHPPSTASATPASASEDPPSCSYPKSFGLNEFIDLGRKPIPWYTQKYIRTVGHEDVTNVATFGHLDAYGARLRNGVIEVIVTEGEGLLTKDRGITNDLWLHSESASYGLGYNDSAGLAPPIQIHAIPLREFLPQLEDTSKCFCDVLIEGQLITILGLVYYPQYGHTLLNGFSNFYALLKNKQFYPFPSSSSFSPDNDIILLHSLRRNTTSPAPDVPHTFYHIKWHEMYNELFSSLVNGISSWEELLSYSQQNSYLNICFERLMIGSPPHLDHLNASVSKEMWEEFTRFLVSKYFSEEIKEYFHLSHWELKSAGHLLTTQQLEEFNPFLTSLHTPPPPFPLKTHPSPSTAPTPHSSLPTSLDHERCLVTFIVRSLESIPSSSSSPDPNTFRESSREILNLIELQEISHTLSCHTQFLPLQLNSIKNQLLELRWNTTLLVLSDGTALHNTLFMNQCSSILRIETWRKPGIVPCLGSGRYWTYTPTVKETYWMKNKSHSVMMRKISEHLHELNQTNSDKLENMPLNILEYPAEEIELYLRDYQLTYVKREQFEEIVKKAKRYSYECEEEKKKKKQMGDRDRERQRERMN
jgi:hypothetical protein